MRRKLLVFAIGGAGVLVVFALLAFVYTPHIVPAAAPVNAVVPPAQMDNSTAMDKNASSTSVDDIASMNDSNVADPVQTYPKHAGRCDSDSAMNGGY